MELLGSVESFVSASSRWGRQKDNYTRYCGADRRRKDALTRAKRLKNRTGEGEWREGQLPAGVNVRRGPLPSMRCVAAWDSLFVKSAADGMLPTVLALAAVAVASAALALMLGERAALRAAHRKFQFVEFPTTVSPSRTQTPIGIAYGTVCRICPKNNWILI